MKEKIRSALSAHRRTIMPPGPVPAAVLLPIYLKEGKYTILLTKRTDHLNHHGGEISFPGGRVNEEDGTLLAAALRETWEEVGIRPVDVEVLGVLDDFYSIHNYVVTPFVGFFPPEYLLTLNADEIDRIIEVPVEHLLRPDTFRAEDWSWKGRTKPVYFYRYHNDEIWGLTAAILKQFLDIVFAPTSSGSHRSMATDAA